MEQTRFNEMIENLCRCRGDLEGKKLYLFGHCEATLSLADVLIDNGLEVRAILDNNKVKHGNTYRGIPVVAPMDIMRCPLDEAVVLIVTRFYESMNSQLREFGFKGAIYKLVDYNTYSEYSFSDNTVKRKRERLQQGRDFLDELRKEYSGEYKVFCPFNALGDVYFCASYLPYYLKNNNIDSCILCVPSNGCRKVGELFGIRSVVIEQKKLDSIIQAVIHDEPDDSYIAHQDRPYVMNMHRALKSKRIPLETMYCCGVFGLEPNTVPVVPTAWKEWGDINRIKRDKTVILSPYAKSVIALPDGIWNKIIAQYKGRGYDLYTNVSGDEKPLPETEPLIADLAEMRSVVERAGTFIGIRSGLCDVIRTAKCKKIALYPDYNYGDTNWKAIEMYSIDSYTNIVVKEDVETTELSAKLFG